MYMYMYMYVYAPIRRCALEWNLVPTIVPTFEDKTSRLHVHIWKPHAILWSTHDMCLWNYPNENINFYDARTFECAMKISWSITLIHNIVGVIHVQL